AGSVSVNLLHNTVQASVGPATSVTAGGNITLLAETGGTVTAFGGTLGVGALGAAGTVVVNIVENTTKAFLDSATVAASGAGGFASVKQFNPDTGAETTQSLKGLIVVATAGEAVNVKAVTASVGTVGLGGNVSVTSVGDTTEAYLRAATVNSAAD